MAKRKNSSKTAWFVLFILLCIGIIAYGGYRIYTSLVLTPSSSRSSDQQGTDEPAVTDILLAELPEDNISFYARENKYVLFHNGNETSFDWSGMTDGSETYLLYADVNGDGEKEIVIILPKEHEDGQVVTNEMHILHLRSSGNYTNYVDNVLSSASMRRQLQPEFKAEQLGSGKRVQFEPLEETHFFRAPLDGQGSYYEFFDLTLSDAKYAISGQSLYATAPLSASFDEYDDPITAGWLSAEITYSEDGQYTFTSLEYKENEETAIEAPRDNVEAWQIRVENPDPMSSTGLALSTIDFELDVLNLEGRDFNTGISEEPYLSYIEVTNSYIRLAVASNMSFDAGWAETGSVTVQLGRDGGYYIQDEIQFTGDSSYNYMTVRFDEQIAAEQMDVLIFHFGIALS